MKRSIMVSGTPYEQGKQQGILLNELIAHNINLVKKKLLEDHLNMEHYREFTQRNLQFIQRDQPELYQEMQGISDGSGLPFEDILQINVPSYFMTDYFYQECSMILARGKATADGLTYVIKNRDMKLHLEQVLTEKKYPNGLRITEVGCAGVVTYPSSGINGSGLGVTSTGFWSPKAPADLDAATFSHVFLNMHLLLSNCCTVQEALVYLKQSSRMNGLNLILADSTDACIVEMTKDDIVVQEDSGDGILFHTNHYTSDRFQHLNPERSAYFSTYLRYERIQKLLSSLQGKVRFQDLFRILSDHEHGTNGICRHPEGGIQARTMSTTLFVLEDLEMWTTFGNPCEQLYSSSII